MSSWIGLGALLEYIRSLLNVMIKGELDPTSTEFSAEYSIIENSYRENLRRLLEGSLPRSLVVNHSFTLGRKGTAIMAYVEGDIYNTTLAIIEKIGDI
ncbi:hypothetical protein N7530_007137 [Penicillium desertorum]|uniref:Uncharacterized protein n=1 Tax=Penicillium desertorum TaxID=1303715 RepID=A0A9W9WLP4_9EURO|nr:hypothetical protein N7530_007137 [Penicillium desertorum]